MSTTQKIFGIGWAKTGTTTLGACFKQLGLHHTGTDLDLLRNVMAGDLNTVRAKADSFTSFEDWPWPLLYRQLDEWYPGSKFILTMRDPDAWLQSYSRMIHHQKARHDIGVIREHLYGYADFSGHEKHFQERYLRHNRDVQDNFRDRPDDLLVLDWSTGAGWTELCTFLDLPIPDTPLPHCNRGSWLHAKVLNWGHRIRGHVKRHTP